MVKGNIILVLLLVISMFGFVVAVDAPSTSVDEGDVEELQGIIDQLPFDDEGDSNFSNYKPFVSKAEERIEAMNDWLDSHAGWMRYLFQMRPQISWLFALNVYFILFFFTIFVLNAPGMWFFIESDAKSRLFGGAMFVIFAAIGLYVGLAHVITNFLTYVWTELAKTSVWMAVLAIIVAVILLIVAFFTGGSAFAWIEKYFDRKHAFKEKTEIIASTKAVDALVEEATKK